MSWRKILVEDNRNSTDNIGGSGEIAYSYDVLGRVDSITEHDDYTILYSYTAKGQKRQVAVTEPNSNVIYNVGYDYDAAGRVKQVSDMQAEVFQTRLAEFNYWPGGNRKEISYILSDGMGGTTTVDVNSVYDRDNHLIGYTTYGGPTFELRDTIIDGLGRLTDANETITKTDGNTVDHNYSYEYDMLSQLQYAYDYVDNDNYVESNCGYYKNGQLGPRSTLKEIDGYGSVLQKFYYANGYEFLGSISPTFYYNYDLNGNMLNTAYTNTLYPTQMQYDWDNRIRIASRMGGGMLVRHSPDGHRVWTNTTETGQRKIIMDPVGDLAVILLEIDPNDDSVVKTYVHANNQIIMQTDGNRAAERYFYLFDRLGTVREIIDVNSDVVNTYLYDPYGWALDSDETVTNRFCFNGQWYDREVNQYYLRARQLTAVECRFTSRDPVAGSFDNPLSLHPYLYCQNDPINAIDPSGEFLDLLFGQGIGAKMRTASASFGLRAMALAGRIYNAAYVRAVGLSMTINRMYYGVGPSSSGSGLITNANKLNHIFSNAAHNLGPLANQFGSEEGAYVAVQAAINLKLAGTVTGEFNQIAIDVGGYTVYVSGIVINGAVQIGTFFMK